ncbi:MAG: TspO/MBR family protein [Eubacteriales bacterium]
MKQNNLKTYVISIAIPLLVGFIGSFATSMGMDTYALLDKPMWTPPGAVFPIVWTLLYVFMGISAARIYNGADPSSLGLYVLQLVLNGIWSYLFFGAGWYFFSFLWIVVLWFVVFTMVQEFYKVDKVAAVLQIPYLIWLTIAGLLNLSIWFLNR